MKFYKKARTFNIYEEAILNLFSHLNKKVTPAEVAEYLGIHPSTAKKTLIKLASLRYIKIEREGKRMYCSRGRKPIKLR